MFTVALEQIRRNLNVDIEYEYLRGNPFTQVFNPPFKVKAV